MGNRLSKIYTRTGDDGSTGLGDGSRVPKDSLRVEAYGTVDELNSLLGLVLASEELSTDIEDCIVRIQHQLFDLGGYLVLPGIISTHEHGTMLMALSSGLTMEMSRDAGIMLGNVRDYVAANPDGPFLSFGGAFEGTVDISRQDIDAIIADQPFLMMAASGHGGWANTRALEMAGIVKGEADPIDSFGREDDGFAWEELRKLDELREALDLSESDMPASVRERMAATAS